MKAFSEQISAYMNNLSKFEWLQQLHSRINWRIVQQFTNSSDSHLNKNWSTGFPFKIDGSETKELVISNPFLSWNQLIKLFSHIGLEINWSKREGVVNSLIISAESSILALMILFFLFALGVWVWQGCHYADFVLRMYIYKKRVTWLFALQTFFTVSPLLIGLLAYGIYGLKCVFFVFTLIGFALALIFTTDLAARRKTEHSNLHADKKIK